MKMHFKDLGIKEKLIMFSNGLEVVEFFEGILKATESQNQIGK